MTTCLSLPNRRKILSRKVSGGIRIVITITSSMMRNRQDLHAELPVERFAAAGVYSC
jgi:hypothetical protein